MQAVALFDALPDFGERPAPASRPAAPDVAPPSRAPDPAELIRTEVERAEAALQSRLEAAHRDELEAEREAHAAALDRVTRQLGAEAATIIEARLAQMEMAVIDTTGATVARILGSVLSDELAARAVDSLADTIRQALADNDLVRIRVQGPQSLIEALRSGIGERADLIDYATAEGFDLSAAIDGTLHETRLAEWSASLAEILR